MRHLLALLLTAVGCIVLSASAGGQNATPAVQPRPVRVDLHGDPLPDGAFARLGTMRYRHGGMQLFGFTPDGKALIYNGGGALHFMEVVSGTMTKSIRYRPSDQDASGFAISGDNKVMAYLTEPGNAIAVVDVASGKERNRITEGDWLKNERSSNGVTFTLSDDGKLLIAFLARPFSGETSQLTWFDTTTGNALHSATAEKNRSFSHAQFTRDGTQIVVLELGQRVAAGANGGGGKAKPLAANTLRVFDTMRGEEVRTVKVPSNNGLSHFELLPDGKTLLGSEGSPTVSIFDFTSGKELKKIRTFGNSPSSFAVSRDGNHLFILQGSQIEHWEITGRHLGTIGNSITIGNGNRGGRFFLGRPVNLSVSSDGKQLACSGLKTATVYDTETGKHNAGGGRGSAISALAFSPDGCSLATSNSDQDVQLWDVKTAKVARLLGKQEFPDVDRIRRGGDSEFYSLFINATAFSADGRFLAAPAGQIGVGVWDARTGKAVKLFGAEPADNFLQQPFTSFAFSPRANVLAIAQADGMLKLWDVESGRELRSWQWHKMTADTRRGDINVLALAFSPDGKSLVGGGIADVSAGMPDTFLVVWESASGKERLRYRTHLSQISPGGGRFEEIFLFLDQFPMGLSYTPDGKAIAIGTYNGIHLVNALTGKDIVTYSGRKMLGRASAFSADGKYLFVGRIDGSLRVLDAATGRVVRDVMAHDEPLLSLAISSDGMTLATGSADSTVLLWHVPELTQPAAPVGPKLTAKELDALWADLAGADAPKAFQAINTLSSAPADSVPFLKSHLKPVAPVDRKVLEKLLDDLNSDKFAVREKATTELEKIGDLAGPIIKERLEGKPPLEMRQRMEKLKEKMQGTIESGPTLQALRGIETLEHIGTPEALQILVALRKGGAGHRVTEDAEKSVERLEKKLKKR